MVVITTIYALSLMLFYSVIIKEAPVGDYIVL